MSAPHPHPRRSTRDKHRPGGPGKSAPGSSAAAARPFVPRDPRRLLQAAGILALLWAVLFAPQLFGGNVFRLGDARAYRPFADFSRERWAEHHVRTYWNPYVFCGVPASPSLADMRPQYLPDAAIDAVEALRPGRWIPLLGPLLALLLGMVSVAALAWLFWDVSVPGLAWAGVAYGFAPVLLVPLAFGHDAFLAACGLMPVAMLAVAMIFESGGRLARTGWALALVAVEGVQALTGHPQVVAYTGVLLAAFAIERTVRTRRWDALVLVALAVAWSAAISCAVWLPAVHYGDHSNRAGGVSVEQVRRMSLAWYELATLGWPLAVGGGGGTYWGGLWNTDYPRFLGTLVMTFALLAAFARGVRRRPHTGFLFAVLAAAVAMALGPRLGPIYDLSFRWLPFFQFFRVTSMGLVVGCFASALLSAAVFGDADERARPRSGPRGRVGWAILGVLVAIALAGVALASGALDAPYAQFATRVRPRLDPALALVAARAAGWDLAWRALLLAAGLELLRRASAGRRASLAGFALLALLCADLLAVSRPPLVRGTGRPETLRHPVTPLLAEIGARAPFARVLSLRTYDVSKWQVSSSDRSPEMRVNDWIRWRANAYGGEHGTPPEHWGGLELLASLDAMRAVGIVFVSNVPGASMDTTTLKPIASARDEVVYRMPDGLGRVYAVPRVVAIDADSNAFKRLISAEFDPAREAITTDLSAAGEYPGSAACTMRWLADEPDTLLLETEAPDRAFVVVADTHFPGWRATVDGAPVTIHRVNHMVRGVRVPAGKHRLEMVYVPEGWARSVPVTRAGMGAWALAALGWLGVALSRRFRVSRAPAA